MRIVLIHGQKHKGSTYHIGELLVEQFENSDILANSIKKEKIHIGIKTKFMFNMMRMMQLNDWGSSKIEKEYWRKNGWLDKKRPW